MTKMIAVYLVLLGLVLPLIMLYQSWRRQHELLCLRNFALLGFMIFQLFSGVMPLWLEWNNRYRLQDWESAGIQYAAMATVFLIVLFIAYELGFGAKALARVVPAVSTVPNLPTILILAVAFTACGVFLKLFSVAVPIPVVSPTASKVAAAFAAIACGLAAWAWAPRLLNVGYASFASVIVVVNLASVMDGAFGRRNLVALGACFLWGMYYSHWRHLPLRAMFVRLAVMSIPPLILLAAFTSIRASQQRLDLQQYATMLRADSDIRSGVTDLMAGQNTAPGSMWLIENYPERYEYRHLMTIRYFFSLPVPRMIWRDKPMPLSTQIATQARIKGVSWDVLKIGPGIIGHAAAEGGWYALIVYGIIGGFFLRFFDQIVRLHPMSPFVVLPVGSALGQIVGITRGETSAFAMNYVVGVVGAYAAMVLLGKFLAMLGWAREEEPLGYEVPVSEYSDYGAGDANEIADASGGVPSPASS
ncbi:MAG: hypothetical protein EA379_08250 [Phycisphaerales bacterium]|nr:MAG: hypothetical protein EA379_08250 [Phycisphaerales bacterium]